MFVSKLMNLVRTTEWNHQMNVDWFFQQQSTGVQYVFCGGDDLKVYLVKCSMIK